MSEVQKDSATRESNREITQNQMLRAENQTLRDERDRLARALREIAYEDIDLMQARAVALTALTPAAGGQDGQ